ncbi:MAG: hypothetical protein WCP89_00680 [archaeon]
MTEVSAEASQEQSLQEISEYGNGRVAAMKACMVKTDAHARKHHWGSYEFLNIQYHSVDGDYYQATSTVLFSRKAEPDQEPLSKGKRKGRKSNLVRLADQVSA